MKAPPSAQFVGSYTNRKAELVVINHKTEGRYRLWNGIPTSIPVPETDKDDSLVLEAGAHNRTFVFKFGPPPKCETFRWPDKYVNRRPPSANMTLTAAQAR